MFNFNLKKIAIFFITIMTIAILVDIFLINSDLNNQNVKHPTILKDTSNNYIEFDSINPNNNNAKIIQTKELENKIEQQTNRIIQDYVWVETNNYIPKNTGGKIVLSSVGRKTFKCDGTIENPDCFEINSCAISKKPCYEYDNGKTIIYVNHFSGAFNTMTWTTDDDWNTGTHTNTTNSTGDLILSGTNITGSYTSNITSTIYAITRIKPIWNSTEQDANKNITIEISANNGANWLEATNNTNYTTGGGIGSGNLLLFRTNFSTNDSAISPKLHDITLDYDVIIPNISIKSIMAYNISLLQAEPYYMGSEIRIRANISDNTGYSNIDSVIINLSWSDGDFAVTNAAMSFISSIDTNTSIYEYNYTIPSVIKTKGAWNISIRANDITGINITNSSTFNATTCVGTEDTNIIVSTTITMIGSCSYNEINITNTGTITTIQGYGLNLSATNLTIHSGGKIDVSGKGYSAGQGPGAGGTGADCSEGEVTSGGGGGGGHGGNGGNGGSGSCGGGGAGGNGAYNSIITPLEFGSGSGNTFGFGGPGGGLIKLNISGTLTNNGSITSNGLVGGAGGSVLINVNNFTGNGTISTIGGNGHAGVTWYVAPGGGGGGGRIAIYYTTKTYTETITAYGGTGSQHGGAGTIYLKNASQTYGDLIVDNGGNAGAETPINSNTDLTEFYTVIVIDGGIISSASSILNLNATNISGNGKISIGSNSINLKIQNISMIGGLITSASGMINITFPGSITTSNFNTTISSSTGAANIFYGATPQDRCDISSANIQGTANYYYSPWSITTPHRCVKSVILDNFGLIDSSNTSRAAYTRMNYFTPR